MDSSESDAKYINSPETLIYNKGSNLYNLNFAKEDIRKKNCIIIVEGYTDVLITQKEKRLEELDATYLNTQNEKDKLENQYNLLILVMLKLN